MRTSLLNARILALFTSAALSLAFTVSTPPVATPASASTANARALADYQTFLLQTGTPITAADGALNFRWVVGDFDKDDKPDLIGIKVKRTGTGRVEAHVLDGDNRYQNFLLQTGTPITAADGAANFRWGAGDYDEDGTPDLFGIKVKRTGTGKVEVHVLSGDQ